MPFPEQIKDALGAVGVSGESLDRIRLARGFVGKSSYVAGAAILVIGAIAIRGSDYPIALAGLVVLIFLIFFFGALWFAHKHPGEALLEGAELIKMGDEETASQQ